MICVGQNNLYDIIRTNLSARTAVHFTHPKFKPSAVLVPLIDTENGHELIFTVRTSKVQKHKGEISFPGGAYEKEHDQSLQATAIREAREEINLSPNQVTILGELDDFCTMTGYSIHPVVGHVSPPYDYQIEKTEVAEVFTVPLDFFKDPAHFEEKIMPFGDWQYAVYYFRTNTHTIWGATAHIVVNFFEAALNFPMPATLRKRPTPEQLLALRGKL